MNRGFIIIEFLVASVLFSLAGSGLYLTFVQGVRAKTRIEESFRTYDPFRVTFLILEKDLRNSVVLKDYPFRGKEEEIQFPARFKNDLFLIRYSRKGHSLIRSEETLGPKLAKAKPEERVLIQNLRAFKFYFPHHNEEENSFFESVWLEEPYYGIPRAVKIEIGTEEIGLEKMVSIPQGKWGYLNE